MGITPFHNCVRRVKGCLKRFNPRVTVTGRHQSNRLKATMNRKKEEEESIALEKKLLDQHMRERRLEKESCETKSRFPGGHFSASMSSLGESESKAERMKRMRSGRESPMCKLQEGDYCYDAGWRKLPVFKRVIKRKK
ncbi:hypothetical protein J6590_065287 [Homalodisca vitripennis]|nr:hypothetical protein J6590_065287 [Homalodisca vitripennis]